MNRIVNNNKERRIDWIGFRRGIIVTIIAFLLERFTPNLLTKNAIIVRVILISIFNMLFYYKISTLKETKFSKALKGTLAFNRTILFHRISIVLAIISGIRNLRVVMLASVGYLAWFVFDSILILKYNKRSI